MNNIYNISNLISHASVFKHDVDFDIKNAKNYEIMPQIIVMKFYSKRIERVVELRKHTYKEMYYINCRGLGFLRCN